MLRNAYNLQFYYFKLSRIRINKLILYSWKFYLFKRASFNAKIKFVQWKKIFLTTKFIKYNKFKTTQYKTDKNVKGRRICFSKRISKTTKFKNLNSYKHVFYNIYTPLQLVETYIDSKLYILMVSHLGNIYYFPTTGQISLFTITHMHLLKTNTRFFKFHYKFIGLYKIYQYLTHISINWSYKLQFCTSKGSLTRLEFYHEQLKLYCLLLPSKTRYYVEPLMLGERGDKQTLIFKPKLQFTKYSFWKKTRGKSVKVRGVAMNPVDHPNGGRTNTKSPYKTPWGRIQR